MKNTIRVLVLGLMVFGSITAKAEWVQGYMRADGSWVAGYYRSSANGTTDDNLSNQPSYQYRPPPDPNDYMPKANYDYRAPSKSKNIYGY